MPTIVVTPLSQIENAIRRFQPSHMITLLSPDHMIETPAGFPMDKHLRLGLEDVAETTFSAAPPALCHIEDLLCFGRTWDAKAPMLVHCWAGVSRSMAAAYILLCERLGEGRELAIARAIRREAPHAYPNPLLVHFADQVLNRKGAMIAAAKSIGRGTIVVEGTCVELPITADDL